MNTDNDDRLYKFLLSRLEAQDRAYESCKQDYRDAMKNYHIFITPITALIIYLLKEESNRIPLCDVIGIILVYGIFIYLRMLGIEIEQNHINQLKQLIYKKINRITPGTVDDMIKSIYGDISFEEFVSVEGIIKRAWAHRGYKTQIGLLNSCFFTALFVIPLWKAYPIYSLFMIPVLFSISVFVHLFYAAWHLKNGLKSFPKYLSAR